MSVVAVDPCVFVNSVRPLLERGEAKALQGLLRTRWADTDIISLLHCTHCDARKVAALCLSLVGGRRCIEPLASRLLDPDPVVNEMAEHALWSIWFRLGKPTAIREVGLASNAIADAEFPAAVAHCTAAIQLDPAFAEAYNQRAIAHYLQEHLEHCIADSRMAVKLMPVHFGAWAGMGHAMAQQGRTQEAVAAYTRALQINPRLPLREVVDQLRAGQFTADNLRQSRAG